MSNVQQVSIKKIQSDRETAEKSAKIEEKRDTRMKIKMLKKPLNHPAPSGEPVQEMYEPKEWKVAPQLLLLEGIARGTPQVLPADYNRLKSRLLHSNDYAYLSEQCMGNYDISSDRLKLLFTVIFHVGQECITAMSEKNQPQQMGNEPGRQGESVGKPTNSCPLTPARPPQKQSNPFEDREEIKIPNTD